MPRRARAVRGAGNSSSGSRGNSRRRRSISSRISGGSAGANRAASGVTSITLRALPRIGSVRTLRPAGLSDTRRTKCRTPRTRSPSIPTMRSPLRMSARAAGLPSRTLWTYTPPALSSPAFETSSFDNSRTDTPISDPAPNARNTSYRRSRPKVCADTKGTSAIAPQTMTTAATAARRFPNDMISSQNSDGFPN